MGLITINTLNLNIELKEVHKLGVRILEEIINLKSITMASKAEIQELLNQISDSTSNIAADLDRLASQAEGGLSAEEADEFVAQLRSKAEALKAQADRNPEPQTPTEPTEPTNPENPTEPSPSV